MQYDNDTQESTRTRREFVRIGALGGAGILAGCMGDDGGDPEATTTGGTPTDGDGTTTDDGSGGVQRHDRAFRIEDRDYAAPEDRHFNPWNPTQQATESPGEVTFDLMALHSPTVNELYPMIATDWSKPEANVLEVEIRDDWKWHDGTDFVVDDYVMQAQIEAAMVSDEGNDPMIQEIRAVDDHFARMTLRDDLSEFYMATATIATRDPVFTKHDDDTWVDYHERIVGGSDSDREEAISELVGDPYPALTDKPPGNGPFRISEVGDDEIVLEVFEDHPNAENINFQRYSFHYFDEPIQAYMSGQIDAMHGDHPVAPDLQGQLPDGHELTQTDRSHNNLVCFNCGHEVEGWDTPFDDPDVRKAVAHVFDKEGLRTLAETSAIRVFEYPPCRVPHGTLEQGTIDVGDFTNYGGNDAERATELLEGAGYTREDGTWYTPDGEEWTVRIVAADANDIVIQTLVTNLNDFGVDTEQQIVDDATFDERRQAGEYDIIPDGSSADGIPDMWDPGLWEWVSGLTHHPDEMTIPLPIGDPDGSEGEKTFSVSEHIRQWRITDDDRFHREMMWGWNQNIPECEMGWKPAAGAINTGNGWVFDGERGVKHGVGTPMFHVVSLGDGLRSTRDA